MARLAGAEIVVALPPEKAQALWMDVGRWPTFIEGFGRVLRQSDDWPAVGSKLVWESNPGGRGRVTERVTASAPGAFATGVLEERLHGTQALAFEPDREGTRVTLRMEYGLTGGGPFAPLTDLLFIRRAVRDALRRTLRRYAVEAQEEGGLR